MEGRKLTPNLGRTMPYQGRWTNEWEKEEKTSKRAEFTTLFRHVFLDPMV